MSPEGLFQLSGDRSDAPVSFILFQTFSSIIIEIQQTQIRLRQNHWLHAKQAPASVNHWQEPVHFLKFRHPQTMQVAVGVDRHRLFGAQFKHRLGCLPGGEDAELSHKNPFQKISPSLSSAFTSSTLRHEHGKGESPQGTTKQPLHEPASLFA